jgi:hypothetical protein
MSEFFIGSTCAFLVPTGWVGTLQVTAPEMRRRVAGHALSTNVTVKCSTLGGRKVVVTAKAKNKVAHLYGLIYNTFFPYPGPFCVLKLVTLEGKVLEDPSARLRNFDMSDGLFILSAIVEPGPLPRCFRHPHHRHADTVVSFPPWYLDWLEQQLDHIDQSDLALFLGSWR